ncbi:hypothetical protein JHK84_035441 [Glycine max]|nr:hypothetical protein JHK86_035129 [Glycine max]KAG5129044.1 hypothetical protein JHK84_035441 [Glycine max]KAH1215031.1 putative histone H2A.1 [Glycine max]
MAGCGKTLGSSTAKKATSRSSKAGLQFPVDLSPVSSRLENMSSVLASVLPLTSPLSSNISQPSFGVGWKRCERQ